MWWTSTSRTTSPTAAMIKNIEKAERAAERKAGKRRKERTAKQGISSKPGVQWTPPALRYFPQAQVQPTLPLNGPATGVGSLSYPYYPKWQSPMFQNPYPQAPTATGVCFSCGDPGHYRPSCPKLHPESRKCPHCFQQQCWRRGSMVPKPVSLHGSLG